ncbi:unnamed protein product [Rotaria sordida]|uniref:DOMON domain-containing protein n=1 Tax=Rotaria sordida TaxID=392033 RepID=A0A819NRC8_9BILA|nr:unnamed protein product [Rotaria sordida]
MSKYIIIILLSFWLIVIDICTGISSPIQPFTTYKHSTELQQGIADLWWTIDDAEQEIIFELHVKSTGWIGLGLSPAGGMKGADIAVGWVESSGNVYLQDRFATRNARPVLDNTTQDWHLLQGRENDGWTAIQFKRLLDTCDSMDFPITSGTNTLIFAYGLVDLDSNRPEVDITYHNTRRNTRIIPLRSYADPPSDDKFIGLDTFEFRLNNYRVPSTDTTYHCKIYKAPSGYPLKRHAIAHKILIDPQNSDLVHHLDLYECDPTAMFNDDNLPDGLCDEIADQIKLCASNLATVWAVGGDVMREFPEEAGYGVGGDYAIKYYMIQIHYDNPRLYSNRRDSTGIQFYLGNELRKYDLGFFTLGTTASPSGLAIPPRVERFVVDSYCPSEVTRNFPKSGINVIFALPHTHLQGISVWTKLIRNNTAIQYLFNSEKYDFNYQFQSQLPKSIKLYPGDSFATRCIYNTMNKNKTTLGGERTRDEMCLHMFTYYPRMNDLYTCITYNDNSAWKDIMNTSSSINNEQLKQWLLARTWTSESTIQWQNFYDRASRVVIYGGSGHLDSQILPVLPTYKDLKHETCNDR